MNLPFTPTLTLLLSFLLTAAAAPVGPNDIPGLFHETLSTHLETRQGEILSDCGEGKSACAVAKDMEGARCPRCPLRRAPYVQIGGGHTRESLAEKRWRVVSRSSE